MVKFNTALRFDAKKRLELMEHAEVVVGIPCFNNEQTIAHVIQTASRGLVQFFPRNRCLVLVSDGGSTDDTREAARAAEVPPGIEKIVTIYRGPGGKGSAFRAVFEAVVDLDARACVVCDSDLRSIKPDWIRHLSTPIMDLGYEYVAPLYSRYKFDGTITNNLVYPLTRALFGVRLRQPIGGDFGFSRSVARYYLDQKVWDSNVARFGVDVWMTVSAITQRFRTCQARLGTKVHDPKDPASSLGPMFRQVIYTLFELIDEKQSFWQEVTGSVATEIFGAAELEDPEPVTVDVQAMIEQFRSGYRNFSPLWERIINEESFAELRAAYPAEDEGFKLEAETWVRIVYDFAAAFHKQKRFRQALMDILCPLYFGRVASFVMQAQAWSAPEAEEEVERQSQLFEEMKPYLKERWVAPRMLPEETKVRS